MIYWGVIVVGIVQFVIGLAGYLAPGREDTYRGHVPGRQLSRYAPRREE